MLVRLVCAANTHNAYAIGKQRSNGFHVRGVIFGRAPARRQKQDDEQVRRCKVMVERAS